MPTYLLVLISILVCLGIVVCLYAIFAYRRMAIAYKKIDYLVEDLAYKSEVLTPAVNTLANLASYGQSVENAVRKQSRSLLDILVANQPKIKKMLDTKRKEDGDGKTGSGKTKTSR